MKQPIRLRLAAPLLLAGFALLAAGSGWCQDAWPSRPVTLVSPYPPGGTTDVLARLLAQRLSPRLGQPVIVENRAGAAGNLGTDYVAKARPDGYTFLVGSSGPVVIAGALYPKLPYKPGTDFTPVSPLARAPFVLVVNARSGLNTVADVVARGREGKLDFGSAGSGSPQHIIGEMFNMAAGTKIQHIPYKGSAPLVNDLVGGQIPMAFDNPVPLMPHIKAGTVRVLAVTSARRSPAFPDIPTLSEAGVRGIDAEPWYGMLGPAGLPPAIVARMHSEVQAILQSPEVRERLSMLAAEPMAMSPAEFRQLIDAEIVKWTAAVKASGATVD
ncbi:Bug family tripartite tricarboxylate transporter substrate binding protein [Caenimonas terrae]|uniref:Bug family tripartite tricarboxylate transporter substrate binding protein n=1 Tax=Caenimonas terrae TaxID=696074 RepID=A0ABW0NAM3_9BURK